MTLKELFNLDIPININVEELADIIGVSYEGFMELLDDNRCLSGIDWYTSGGERLVLITSELENLIESKGINLSKIEIPTLNSNDYCAFKYDSSEAIATNSEQITEKPIVKHKSLF